MLTCTARIVITMLFRRAGDMGGSTNVMLHSVEIARAAGIDLWKDVLSQDEFNALSHHLPVIVNMRPFGTYSMVDVDGAGGLPTVVNE